MKSWLLYSTIRDWTLIMSLIFAQMGCANRASSNDFREVFADFTFVEMGQYVPMCLPTHGIERKEFPSRMENNSQYVFHHESNLNDDEIYKALLLRLRTSGLEIKSSNIDDYWYVGGPGFHINFEGKGYRGSIHNEVDGRFLKDSSLIKKWNIDDYILVIEKA